MKNTLRIEMDIPYQLVRTTDVKTFLTNFVVDLEVLYGVKARLKTPKLKKVCTNCYGKKWTSVYSGAEIAKGDFLGEADRVMRQEGVEMRPCPKCNKKGRKK